MCNNILTWQQWLLEDDSALRYTYIACVISTVFLQRHNV